MADIFVNILGDASKLKGELDKSSKNVTSFTEKIGKIGKIATVAGAAVTAAFTAIVLKSAAVGDQFDKMSLRTGIAVEDLSALAYASDICGTDIGTLEIGLKGLTKTMDDASIGIGEGKEAFEELGISVVDIEGNLRPTIDVLKEAATKISEIENPTKQAALAMDLFGARAGPKLLPLLKMGGAGIEDLMAKAKELGIVVSTEAATAAAEFTDRLTDLKGSLAGAGRMIGDTLIPAITPLIEKATEIVGRIKEWAEENAPLVEGIFKWGAGLGLALMVLGPIAVILPSLIAGVTLLAGAFLPLAIGGAVVLGIIKLSEYMGKIKEDAFEAATGFKEWSLDKLNMEIFEMEKTISDLNIELAEAEKEFKLFGITIKNQDVNVDRLKQVIKDYGIQLGLLKKQKEEHTKAEQEGIDVTEEKLKREAEAKKLMDEIAEKTEEAREAIEDKTKAAELATAQMKIENDIYALTHSAMEVSIRDLDTLRQSYLDKGIAQEIVNEWYDLEIKKLKEVKVELEDNVSIMEEVARVTKAVEDRWFELTKLPYEVKIKNINEKYDDYIKVIKESNLGLLAQETAIRNINLARDLEIEGVDKITEAEKEATRQKELLIDAYKTITDKIYELTHTPMETMIRKLEEERQGYIDLGISIELADELFSLQILKLGEVGEAFTLLEQIASPAISKIVGYITDNLGTAIYNLWSDMEDYEWDWNTFWEGLWDTVKRTVSNIIAKLLILIPILAIVAFFTGGLNWATIQSVLSFVGISFSKGGGVGYDFGGEIKGYQAGGMADTIPARLTVGEYVIAKPMTDFIKKFKAIPENLIAAVVGGFPTPTPAFAGGGSVGSPNITSTGYGDTNINVYISGNKISDDVDIRKLASTVSDEILRKINLKKRH